MTLTQPYRGDGTARPRGIPLPPDPLPLFFRGALRKQWRYVAVWSSTVYLCAARVGVGPARQEFWAVWDRGARQLWERTRLWGSRVELSDDRVQVRDDDVEIDVGLAGGSAIEVVLPTSRAYTWTRKVGAIRAEGIVRLGRLSLPVNGLALIDESAGYHPRHTTWYWSAGAGYDESGRQIAWNLVSGQNDAARDSERTIWIDGQPVEVGPVRFAPDLSSVESSDGSILSFAEEAVRQRRDNLLLIRSSYRQPFGTFSGTLPHGIRLREGHGVMEWHDAVW